MVICRVVFNQYFYFSFHNSSNSFLYFVNCTMADALKFWKAAGMRSAIIVFLITVAENGALYCTVIWHR